MPTSKARIFVFFALYTCVFLSPISVSSAGETVLDQYVHQHDSHYRYRLAKVIRGEGYDVFLIRMTSQAWRTSKEVDKPLWKHWLVIFRPHHVENSVALLRLALESDKDPLNPIEAPMVDIALKTKSVVATLWGLPNAPLVFKEFHKTPLDQDHLLASSWARFLETEDSNWPAQLPMTKSAVRAMDTVRDFCASKKGGKLRVDRFVITGESKHGWVSLLAAAVDKRVVAVMPIFVDILHVDQVMKHHFRVYGVWSKPLHAYEWAGIMSWIGTEQFSKLLSIVDPYSYRDRLTLPKFLIHSTGDRYFPPDSSQFYFDELLGETYLRYVPNTDHSIGTADEWDSLSAYYQSILENSSRPRFSWKFDKKSEILNVKTIERPAQVKLWKATNPSGRDFRLQTIGKIWASEPLIDLGDGLYKAKVSPPSQGWTAFFVELTYDRENSSPFKFTTQVYVVPDKLPYDDPKQDTPKKPSKA